MATVHQNLSEYDSKSVPSGEGLKIAIVLSEWNYEITGNLANGAIETLVKHGVDTENILKHFVPGSFELPLGAQLLLEHSEIDAVICVGCVIQGETKHFDYVCASTAQGITDVGLKYNKPVVFCVLTDDNIEQSRARSGGEHGNKGIEAAISALKMITLQNQLSA